MNDVESPRKRSQKRSHGAGVHCEPKGTMYRPDGHPIPFVYRSRLVSANVRPCFGLGECQHSEQHLISATGTVHVEKRSAVPPLALQIDWSLSTKKGAGGSFASLLDTQTFASIAAASHTNSRFAAVAKKTRRSGRKRSRWPTDSGIFVLLI